MILVACIFFSCLFWSFGAVESANAQARMVIPESTFDFGFVPQHSKISHDFWLHSAGTDTLKILKVRPG